MIRLHIIGYLICAYITLFSFTVNAATVAVIDGGLLKGFTGVEIGSNIYNVVFKDNSFNADIGVLDFNSKGTADDASQALLDALELYPLYDNLTNDTFGCFENTCTILTPYLIEGSNVYSSGAHNDPNDIQDIVDVTPHLFFDHQSLLLSGARVYADWAYVGTVPIPASVWLFGSGLLGLIGIARRKKLA